MKLTTKIEIFIMAIVLTFILFDLMIPPHAIELLKIGKQAGNEIIANVVR